MISVILLMAGIGKRCKQDKNKILINVGKKPIYKYSLDLFNKYDFEIICVVNKNDYDELKYIESSNIKLILGGDERYDSVFNGIKASSGDYLIIHDAARPFLDSNIVDEILKIKDNDKCILTYFNLRDTVYDINTLNTINRDELILASTPQCGPKDILFDSYNRRGNLKFTDDISLVRYFYPNIKIDLIKSNDDAFKITTPIDIKIAEGICDKYD